MEEDVQSAEPRAAALTGDDDEDLSLALKWTLEGTLNIWSQKCSCKSSVRFTGPCETDLKKIVIDLPIPEGLQNRSSGPIRVQTLSPTRPHTNTRPPTSTSQHHTTLSYAHTTHTDRRTHSLTDTDRHRQTQIQT